MRLLPGFLHRVSKARVEEPPDGVSSLEEDRLGEVALALEAREAAAEAVEPGPAGYVRGLHTLGVEHLRRAIELEVAARHHRAAARSAARRAWVALSFLGSGGPVDDTTEAAVEVVEVGWRAVGSLATPVGTDAPRVGQLATVDDDVTAMIVQVLGPLSVQTAGGHAVAWTGTRARTLFEYLLLNGHPVHREELMELLWPGYSYGSARNNLNVCLHGMRRSLQVGGAVREHVVYRDGCYGLNRDVTWSVDRDRFLSLATHARSLAAAGSLREAISSAASATELYAGPLFEDDPATEWFAAERQWLRERHLDLLELEVGLRLDVGDVDVARVTAGRILCEDQCRESGHRLLMRCYARQNQGDLLTRQYQQCVNTLDRQLGIGPTTETIRLYHDLTSSRPSGRGGRDRR